MAERIGPLYLNPDGGITHIDSGAEVPFGDEALAAAVLRAAGGVEAITGPAGRDGAAGADGADGAPGRDGAAGADGVGVPAGGTTGQALVKASETDYDTEWSTAGGGGGDVASVNGQTGVVVLDAEDVRALPDDTALLRLGTTSATALRGDYTPPADQAAGTASLRRLGTTSTTAAAGNDSRLSDSRAPRGTAGGVLSGTYPDPGAAAGSADNPHTSAAASRNTALTRNWWECATEPTNWTTGDRWLRTAA